MAATNMTPVSVTGFNRDVVVENTASGPPFTSAAMEFNTGEGTAFYQSGLSGHSFGLPVSGLFINGSDATMFQFQPYTASNALVLSSDTATTSGTLTLTPPTAFSKLAILANSGNGDGIGSAGLTLNFQDGSTFVTNYFAPDWFFNNSTANYTVALQGVERFNISSGAADGAPGDPLFYQTTLPLFQMLGGNNRPISSITFNQAITTDGITLDLPGALAGDSDTAAAFDGSLGVMTLPFAPALSLAAPFTVETWLKPATTRTSDADVVCALCAGHFGSPRSGWILYQALSGWNFRIFNQNGTTPSLNIIGGPPPAVGVWQHVVAVYNGTNGFVYVNGVLRISGVAAGFVANTDGALTVGMRNDGNFAWAGVEDEVAIYTNALPAADVLAHYQNGTNAASSQPYSSLILARNPLLYFRLDETNLASRAVNQGTAA
ncbi:MAG TPA: LamG domain-containing protein, partial [Verrucomicrobiae bacterium]|nr:LamG domain-containing protein [Verrucomicrobiae bacterium]